MADISTRWEVSQNGDLKIVWTMGGGLKVARYLLGVPLLAVGLFFLAIVLMNLGLIVMGKGMDLIAGTLVAIVIGAIVLPIGWWVTFNRSHFSVPNDGSTVTEVMDWRVGRKVKIFEVENYRAVRLSVERITDKTSQNASSNPAMGIRVALQPKDRKRTHPLAIGWFEAESEESPKARELAVVLSEHLGRLPIEDKLGEWFEE